MSGAWRITFSMVSTQVSRQGNKAYLYLNDGQLDVTEIKTYSENGEMRVVASRVVTLETSAGDAITLRTDYMNNSFWKIYFCAEYIPRV